MDCCPPIFAGDLREAEAEELASALKAVADPARLRLLNLIAAAGVTELIVCLMAIRDGVLPATINYENPDPECDLDYTPNVARETKVRTVLSNSFGFGGTNGSLILRAVD